jgi:hypothetical protein
MFKSNIAAILLTAWTQLPLRNLRVVFSTHRNISVQRSVLNHVD